jgi:hypothetical protein
MSTRARWSLGRDWFGNGKHKEWKAGPHTGTGDSGQMGKIVKVTFKDSKGNPIKGKGKK